MKICLSTHKYENPTDIVILFFLDFLSICHTVKCIYNTEQIYHDITHGSARTVAESE